MRLFIYMHYSKLIVNSKMAKIHNRFQSAASFALLLFLAFAVTANNLKGAQAAAIDETNLEELSRDDAAGGSTGDTAAVLSVSDNTHRVKRGSCDLGRWACVGSCQVQNCGTGYCSGGICRCSRCARGKPSW